MKNSNYIINGILLAAIIVLFILHFTGRQAGVKQNDVLGAVADSADFQLPIAYIQTDSLLLNYRFYKDLSNDLEKKSEDKSLEIRQKEDKLKKEVADFYQKVQNNIFYNEERQSQEQNRLMGMQNDLERFADQARNEMALEHEKMMQQLQDTIVSTLKLYNIPKKYQFIFSNVGTDNIYYANDISDITKEFTEFLNVRYVPQKK